MAVHWTLESPKSPDEVRETFTHYLKSDCPFLHGAMTEAGFKWETRFRPRVPRVCLSGRIHPAEHGSVIEVTVTRMRFDVILIIVSFPIITVAMIWAAWPVIQQGFIFPIPLFIIVFFLIYLLFFAWPEWLERRRAKRQLISLLAMEKA